MIQLPSNLFFGTSIATCIMVLKKNKQDNKTLFIDATNECIKVTNNNKLTADNINRIVDTFTNRTEEAHFSHLASYEEIAEQEYNLSVSTYVEAEDTRENITVVGCWTHLRRRFDQAMKSLPKGKVKNSSAAQGLGYCTLLFEIEKGLKAEPPEELLVCQYASRSQRQRRDLYYDPDGD